MDHEQLQRRAGSSPRMRGAPSTQDHTGRSAGIIPAYAGSTMLMRGVSPPLEDHPRVCGEHESCQASISTDEGSSPRMRGAQSHGGRRFLSGRIIPAYAGSTHLTSISGRMARDHPRVCGEHQNLPQVCGSRYGSSPRMRGARKPGRAITLPTRIIPAYAGSTCPSRVPKVTTGDHPRVCGEHWGKDIDLAIRNGSSPRMRGARRYSRDSSRWARIIPAYAGSTTRKTLFSIGLWDHPRVCGEHFMTKDNALIVQGSSPRMRGAPCGITDNGTRQGIIPAYAGSTISPCYPRR